MYMLSLCVSFVLCFCMHFGIIMSYISGIREVIFIMFISGPRYLSLGNQKPVKEKEYYQGVFQNKPIIIDRQFREHRLTDDECKALCDGEVIEIHNLHNKGTAYGVRGMLREDLFSRGCFEMPVYVFKATMPVLNKPDYDFSKRHVVKTQDLSNNQTVKPKDDESDMRAVLAKEESDLQQWAQQTLTEENTVSHTAKSHTKKPRLILHASSLDEYSDEEDSKLAARVAASTDGLTPVVPLYKTAEDLKVYVPVIAGMVYTKNGITVVPDEDAMREKYDVPDDIIVFVPPVDVSEPHTYSHTPHTEVKDETALVSEEPTVLEESFSLSEDFVASELENAEFMPTDINERVNSDSQVDDSQPSHTQESQAEFATRMCRMAEEELRNKTYDEVIAEARAYISDREYAEYEPDYEEVDDEDDSNKESSDDGE